MNLRRGKVSNLQFDEQIFLIQEIYKLMLKLAPLQEGILMGQNIGPKALMDAAQRSVL